MVNIAEPKKRWVSLSKHCFTTVAKETLADITSYKMPDNSTRSSKWALKNLRERLDVDNKRNLDNLCLDDALSHTCCKALLNKWLLVYINEMRFCIGEPYPPKRCVLCCVEL